MQAAKAHQNQTTIGFQQKQALLYSLIIFLVAFILRAAIAYVSYGGGDATNGASFIDFYNNEYDIYSTISPWPYLPFSNSFLWVWVEISDALDISTNLAYRLFSSFFDACIATLIFYYLFLIDNKNAITISLVYALNPITVVIVATLGFTDSFTLLFLLMAVVSSELKQTKYSEILIGFFLAVSISAKPMTLIFVPYFLYRSNKYMLFLGSLLTSLFVLNSYYLIGASFDNIIGMLSLVLGKITLGHQSGVLGIGALTNIIGMGTTKVITTLGLPILAAVYILSIRVKPVEFILIVFSALLVFRYNFHLQYMAWIVPFALLANKKVLPYLTIGGLALVVSIFDWNDSAGAFALLNDFGIDRENNESVIGFIYQYLSGPIFLGAGLIASIFYIHNRQFYREFIGEIYDIVTILPRMTIKPFFAALFFSLLLGYIYLEVISMGGGVKIGIYLRALFLISMPTFAILYLLFYADIRQKKTISIIAITFFICTLLLAYWLLLQGYKKPYNSAFLYSFITTPIVLYVLFSNKGKLHRFVELGNSIENIKNSASLKFIFSLASLLVIILLTLPWKNLSQSASNQFVFNVDEMLNLERKVYSEITLKAPKSIFSHGNNYIYRASVNTREYFDMKDVASIDMILLADSHYLLQVNNVNISSGYSPLYYMRHSTKRKYYNYGSTNINLDKHIRDGDNEIKVVNNLSSPVSPVGISPILLVKYINGNEKKIDLTDIQWDIYKGEVSNNGDILSLNNLESHLLTMPELGNKKYELDMADLPDFLEGDTVFIAPRYTDDSSKSVMSPVDIFLLLSLSLLLMSGWLLNLSQRHKSDKNIN